MTQTQGFQAQEIRRHHDGSINFDFYRYQSRVLRTQAMQDAFSIKPKSASRPTLLTALALSMVVIVISAPLLLAYNYYVNIIHF